VREIAPELLVAECANILWKKVQRDELTNNEAFLAAQLLEAEFLPTRSLLEAITRTAIELSHPAFDCLCRFVTADDHFLRKLNAGQRRKFRDRVIGLRQVT
jgi:predicted nucleic acid-binding protein